MDYWLPFRSMAIDFLSGACTSASLDRDVARITDKKKTTNYAAAASGLKKWKGRKQLTCRKVAGKPWTSGGLIISVTPELIISWQGSPAYVVKLYFSADPLSK